MENLASLMVPIIDRGLWFFGGFIVGFVAGIAFVWWWLT